MQLTSSISLFMDRYKYLHSACKPSAGDGSWIGDSASFGGVTTSGVAGFSLVTRKAALTCVPGVGVTCGTEGGLPGSLGIHVASFGGGELMAVCPPKSPPDVTVSSVDLLNKPPYVPRAGTEGLPNKLRGAWMGALSCSPKSPPPVLDCGEVNAVPRLEAGGSPDLPKRENDALRGGVLADSDVGFVDGVPRENGGIFDKSGFFFCDSGVFH